MALRIHMRSAVHETVPRRRAFRLAGLTAAAFLAQAQPACAAGPWGEMAKQDLVAIRDTLAANHPGPVDPQNHFYADWLRQGFAESTARAEQATGYGDYTRALRFYTNGFRDGHIGVSFTMTSNLLLWPRFLVKRSEADGKVVVATALDDSGVPAGAELISCDGKPVTTLMEERLDPFSWNADIPHARWNSLPAMFVLQPSDTALRLKSCTFVVSGKRKEIGLGWQTDPRQTVLDQLAKLAPPRNQLGLRQSGDIWFVTLPSFNYSGEAAAPIKGLIEELKQKAPKLRKGIVVLDVRGNGGGNSAWGEEIASALWSREMVDRVTGSFDWTVDWRVSPDNIAHLERIVAQNERDGLTEAAASWRKALEAMKQAAARGEQLVRVPSPPKRFKGHPPANPVSGRVFLLTDGACASACLDFTDLVRRLPNATHIGLPTSADAVYIDNTYAPLPSGLAGLSYSLKVYRNRVRANNQWYEPQVRWPGGEMTDEALARWISSLPVKEEKAVRRR